MARDSFLRNRKILSEKMGSQELYSVIDQWPLYTGKKTLARMITILDLFKSIIDVEGDIAEFGSHKGANILFFAKLTEIYGIFDKKKVHCFEGLTNFKKEDGNQENSQGRYQGNLAALKDVIELFEYNEAISIHKGFIEDTLPPFLEKNPDQRFSLIYYDADLYEPCKVVLDNLHQKLNVGGVFIFDEYGHEDWPGETQAVDEFIAAHENFAVEKPTMTEQPGLVLRKTK